MWLKNWMESKNVPAVEIRDLEFLKGKLDNTFGVRRNILDFILDSVKRGIPKPLPDVIISKERKGTKLLQNFSKIRKCEINHIPLELLKPKDVKGKRVLIFDDGIHYGNTAREAIKKVLEYEPSFVELYSTIADKETLNKLREDFPQIGFICSEEVPPETYTITYNRLFYRLFDVLPGPLDNHLEYHVQLTTIEKPKPIADALKGIIGTTLYRVPTLEEEELDVIKGTILFNKAIPIQGKIDCNYVICMYKIRFYIYFLSKTTGIHIIFTPVIQLWDADPKSCERKMPWRLCNNHQIDEKACLDCIEINLTISLFKNFISQFEKKMKAAKIYIANSSLKWNLAKKYEIEIEKE